jgi:hypothetical protein
MTVDSIMRADVGVDPFDVPPAWRKQLGGLAAALFQFCDQ